MDIDPTEWLRLTAAERAEKCRLMAEQTQSLANGAPPELREGYLRIAASWLRLADELERAEL